MKCSVLLIGCLKVATGSGARLAGGCRESTCNHLTMQILIVQFYSILHKVGGELCGIYTGASKQSSGNYYFVF